MTIKYLKKYLLSLLTTIAICILSLAPIGAPEMARGVPFYDKWTHMVMYGALTFMVLFETTRQERKGQGVSDYESAAKHSFLLQRIVLGLFFPILLGGLMEVCQACLTTYRSGEWMDFVADSMGSIVVYTLLSLPWRGTGKSTTKSH